MRIILIFICISILPAITVSKKSQDIFKQALEFNAIGDYPSAIYKFIDAYNEDAGILGFNDEGTLKNAATFFNGYLDNNPQDLNSLMWMGTIETLRGNARKAIEYYEKVVLYAPKSPEGLEADKEIIRLEKSLKGDQEKFQKQINEKKEKEQDAERIKENVKRELDAVHKERIAQLEEKIRSLSEENIALVEKEQRARKELLEIQGKIADLEKDNAHHRRMYLFYKNKVEK